MGMGGMFTFSLWRCIRERVICRDLQFGVEWCKDRFKLGGQFLFGFLHWGLHGCIYGCSDVCIDGGNNSTELFHLFLGLEETRLQGVEASFQVLATGMGHEDGWTKKGPVGSKFFPKMIWMNVIREKRWIQWNRSQIMVKKIPDIFFFYTCGVILRFEEYCSDEMPKFLTRKKCVVIWKPEHSCMTIDLVCFNLFMFLSPKG